MKKLLLMMSVLSVSALLFAEDVKVNTTFAGSTVGAAMPTGWWKNFDQEKNVGKSVVVKDGEALAVKITTTDLRTPMYSNNEVPVKPGDVLDFSARFKGQGQVKFFFYGYSINGDFLCEKGSTPVQISGDQVVTAKLTVDAVPGKDLKKVCLGWEVNNNSDVTISQFKIEKNAALKK